MNTIHSIIRSAPIEAGDSLRQRLKAAEALYGRDREWAATCRNHQQWGYVAEGLGFMSAMALIFGFAASVTCGLVNILPGPNIPKKKCLAIVASCLAPPVATGAGAFICFWEGRRRKNEIADVPDHVDQCGYNTLSNLDIDKINRHGRLPKDESLCAVAAVAMMNASTAQLNKEYLPHDPDGFQAQYDANLTAVRDWFEKVKYTNTLFAPHNAPIGPFATWRGNLL